MFVPLETVAHPSSLVEVVPSCPIKFIRGGFGRRNENVNGEQYLGFTFDLADTQTVSLVHENELESLT